MNKIIFFIICALFIHVSISAQTPANDPHWQLVWEDNFNGTSVNTGTWSYFAPWGNCNCQAHQTNGANHEFSNGIIKLVSKKENSVCWECDHGPDPETRPNPIPIGGGLHTHALSYTTGALCSKEAFKYGYFEIRCKLPELSNTQYTGKGFSPGFWMTPYWTNCYGGYVKYSEIDFFEIDATNNLHTCNAHYSDIDHPGTPGHPYWSIRTNAVYDFTVNFNDFHKFSGEWSSKYINFYFDDQLFRSTSTEYVSQLIPMNIIMGIATPADNFTTEFVSNTLFPYKFEIDYLKIYHLKCGDKNIVVNEINFNSYNYTVKKSITMSGATTIPKNKSIFLRATDFIELKSGFEVPLGTNLFLAATPCDNCIIQPKQ